MQILEINTLAMVDVTWVKKGTPAKSNFPR